MEPRKRVLFVERGGPCSAPECTLAILYGLREHYDVVCEAGLSAEVVKLLMGPDGQPLFDALITHLPFRRVNGEYDYREGFELLSKLRLRFANPIIIYSGAPILTRIPVENFADADVDNSVGIERSLQLIIEGLEKAWARLDAAPPPPPNLMTRDNWTMVEATVRIVNGIVFKAHQRLYKECKTFTGRVYFEHLEKEKGEEQADVKDAWELLLLTVGEGDVVRICVEGSDAAARRLARRLYGGVVSTYAGQMDFDRFDPESERAGGDKNTGRT